MGQNLSLGIISEFIITDEEKSKELARKFFEDMGSKNIPYDNIDELSSYITTDYMSDENEVKMTLQSYCDDWFTTVVCEGNLGLYIEFYSPSEEFSKMEKHKNYLEKLSNDIKIKYGFDFKIYVYGSFG